GTGSGSGWPPPPDGCGAGAAAGGAAGLAVTAGAAGATEAGGGAAPALGPPAPGLRLAEGLDVGVAGAGDTCSWRPKTPEKTPVTTRGWDADTIDRPTMKSAATAAAATGQRAGAGPRRGWKRRGRRFGLYESSSSRISSAQCSSRSSRIETVLHRAASPRWALVQRLTHDLLRRRQPGRDRAGRHPHRAGH